jgi:hypothetical protein
VNPKATMNVATRRMCIPPNALQHSRGCDCSLHAPQLIPVPGDSTDMRAWGTQMRYQGVSLPVTCETVD